MSIEGGESSLGMHSESFVCDGDNKLGSPVCEQGLSVWVVITVSHVYNGWNLPVPDSLVAPSTRGAC